MKSLVLAPIVVVGLVLGGCGGNAVPSISSFTLSAGTRDAAGDVTIDGKITATDPDEGDRVVRLETTASGPAAVQVPAIQVPEGVTVKDLPFRLKLPGAAPKGSYTFTVKAYDEAGEASAEASATVDVP